MRYLVDGSPVVTHAVGVAQQMRPLTSDFNGRSGALARLDADESLPGSGSFDSRAPDAGQSANWGALNWNADTPAGTGIALSVRTGNTPTPDASWSGFSPIATGGTIRGTARYLQYRAQLTSSDPATTPRPQRGDGDYVPGRTRSADDHRAHAGPERDRGRP